MYMSPEVNIEAEFGHEVDMWAFGCILYEMYTGERLFSGVKTSKELVKAMIKLLGNPPTNLFPGRKLPSGSKSVSANLKMVFIITIDFLDNLIN